MSGASEKDAAISAMLEVKFFLNTGAYVPGVSPGGVSVKFEGFEVAAVKVFAGNPVLDGTVRALSSKGEWEGVVA